MRPIPQSRADSHGRGRPRFPALPRWVWSLIGGAIGLFDFALLIALDANMLILGRDATVLMGILFFVPYALLGWAVGGLAQARERADRDRETIARQLRDLERAQRALVQEEKLAGIGRLAAGVAHEVRNPLGVIRASASMVRESFDTTSDPYRALGFICEETDRLDRLIASLLTFAKPQPIECVPTAIPKLFDRVLDLARPEARQHDIALEVSVAPGLPTLLADPDRLSQALFGLVLNAIQAIADVPIASPDTDRRVLLSAGRGDDRIRLSVADSGPGVDVARQDQIFEPFVTSKETGTGLGLPMALRMIEAQGGVLSLASPGAVLGSGLGGACFVAEFPIARGDDHDRSGRPS